MLFAPLGNTGLTVSRMGLGCGGHSRLGMARGASKEEAARIVREALDLGVNFIDTAEAYGTEEAVGLGLRGVPRERFVVSTKFGLHGHASTAEDLKTQVEASLRRLELDQVDVFHLHAVTLDEYPHAREVLLPELSRLKEAGKIAHIGITERFIADPGHQMLAEAVPNDPWEVVMVGFSLLNPSARQRILPTTRARGIGTLDMFAVRRAIGDPGALRDVAERLLARDATVGIDPADPLGFLTAPGVADSLQEAAYRFCLWEPGIDVVLSGTGNVDHLRENVKSLEGPTLPAEALERLAQIFGNVNWITGE